MRGLGYPMYVNGKLFNEPVTISHVPGMPVGAADPSMGALGQYVAYAPTLPPLGSTVETLPGSSRASLPPVPAPPPAPAHADAGGSTFLKIWSYLALPSSLACAYHGYKRNSSVGWALWWGLVGSMPITPIIALAQGFGKPKAMTPNRKRRRRNSDFDSEKFFRDYDWRGGTAGEMNKLQFQKERKLKKGRRTRRRRRRH